MLKRFFAFLVSVALIASPLMAEGLNSSDLNFAFGTSDTQAPQLSSDLSIMTDQQMSETEGEFWKLLSKVRATKPRFDKKPHKFSWPVKGPHTHYQTDLYIKGLKNSTFLQIRIPVSRVETKKGEQFRANK